jgi:hypothetical protein
MRRVLAVAVGLWLGCSAPAPSVPSTAQAAESGAKPKTKEKPMLKSDADFAGAYKSFLEKSGKPTELMNENKSLRKGDWRFFARGDRPGVKFDEAAVSASGEVIDQSHQPAWYAFLSQPGVSPSELVQRYCWLHGQLAAIEPGTINFRDARIAPLIEKPTLTQHGDTATLRFWVLYPPNMQDPARLTLTAKKGAPLHTESANWHEVAGLAPAASPSHPLEGQAPSLFGKP